MYISHNQLIDAEMRLIELHNAREEEGKETVAVLEIFINPSAFLPQLAPSTSLSF